MEQLSKILKGCLRKLRKMVYLSIFFITYYKAGGDSLGLGRKAQFFENFEKLSKVFKGFLKKIGKMHYFNIFFK